MSHHLRNPIVHYCVPATGPYSEPLTSHITLGRVLMVKILTSLITEQIDRSLWNLVSVWLPYHLRLFHLQNVHPPINNNNKKRVVGTSYLGMTTASMSPKYFCDTYLQNDVQLILMLSYFLQSTIAIWRQRDTRILLKYRYSFYLIEIANDKRQL
jgi:hypothetical protein